MFELIYKTLVVMGVITLVAIAMIGVLVYERVRRDRATRGDEDRRREKQRP